MNVFLDLDRKNRQLAVQAEQLRRLLVAEQSPGRARGSAAEGPLEGTRTESAGEPGRMGAGTGGAERLAEIIEKLVQIELVLRDPDNDGPAELADRIAELERTIRNLGSRGSE